LKKITALFLFAIVISVFTTDIIAADSISIFPKEYDFGKVLSDSHYSYLVKITNTGDEVVKLVKIKATCGCTIPMLKKNILGPGESTELTVKFDSGLFRGGQRKFVYIFTDKGGKYRIAFNAFVIGKYEFSPKFIKLSPADLPFEQDVVVKSNDGNNKSVIEEIRGTKGIMVTKKNQMMFHIVINDGKYLKHENDVIIYLKNRGKPLVYKVFFSKSDDLELNPKTISFLNLKGGVYATKDCLVVSDKKLKVLDVNFEVSWLKYIGSRSSKRGLVIKIGTIPEKMVKGFGKTVVNLVLSDENNKKVNVKWPVIFNLL
jgi:hypothetical protein